VIGLPSLQAMDRAQGARIWMASEATDKSHRATCSMRSRFTITPLTKATPASELMSRMSGCSRILKHILRMSLPAPRRQIVYWPLFRRLLWPAKHEGTADESKKLGYQAS
jgi:hypothetical protein